MKNGYNVSQLLGWCKEDGLIERYRIDGDHVLIFRKGSWEDMTAERANALLKRLYRDEKGDTDR